MKTYLERRSYCKQYIDLVNYKILDKYEAKEHYMDIVAPIKDKKVKRELKLDWYLKTSCILRFLKNTRHVNILLLWVNVLLSFLLLASVNHYVKKANEPVEPVIITNTVTEYVEVEVPIMKTRTRYVEKEIEEESIVEMQTPSSDVILLAKIMKAEAENQSDEGKQMVISTVLNRVDSDVFPDTIYDVIYDPYQYYTAAFDSIYVTDDDITLVQNAINNRINTDVLYFRTNHYHTFGTPVCQVGDHYFSM